MPSRRCSNCDLNYPDDDAFSPCPQCGGQTWKARYAKPIAKDEAHSIIKWAEFERHYAEHDAARVGPTPEEVGAAEAREISRLEREFSSE